jgi:hypothetical protein
VESSLQQKVFLPFLTLMGTRAGIIAFVRVYSLLAFFERRQLVAVCVENKIDVSSTSMPLAEDQAHHGNMAKSGGFQFRLALPFGQLVLCAFILWPVHGLILSQLGLPRTTDVSIGVFP